MMRFFLFFCLLLSLTYGNISTKVFNDFKKKLSIFALEKDALKHLSQVDITALSQVQLMELYQLLFAKGFHIAIVDHLFASLKQEYPDVIYTSLLLLNELQRVLEFALSSLDENSPHISSHLNALEQIAIKGSPHLFTNQTLYPLKGLNEKDNHLLKFYLAFFQKNFVSAYNYLVKANLYSNANSILEKHFTMKSAQVLETFYEQAHYKEFLQATTLTNLFKLLNSPQTTALISQAITYIDDHPELVKQLIVSLPPLIKIKNAFYSNDYRYLSGQTGQTNIFLAISLLELKEYTIYSNTFLNYGEHSFYHLLWYLYERDENKFKNHFLVKSILLEEELEIKNLIQLNEANIPMVMEIIRLKYSHSPSKLQSLYLNQKKDLPLLIRDYIVVSLMEMHLKARDYEQVATIYKEKYIDIDSPAYQERALYYYAKSLENNFPLKAKSIYEKLLFKNPNTFYKFHIQTFLNKLN